MAVSLAELERAINRLEVEVRGIKLGLENFLTAKQQEEFWAEVERMKQREANQERLRRKRRKAGGSTP